MASRRLDGLYNDETKDLYIDGEGEIDENSFKNTTSFPVKDVKRIFIGTGLIVCDNAFADFDSLKSVIISYPRPGLHLSLRKKGCSQILSHLIESYLSERKIGDSAFSFHENLTNVTILKYVTEIGAWAFSGCTALTKIIIPNSVTEIGNYAFKCCKNLKKIIIPNSVTEMGDGVFLDCTALKEVQLSKLLHMIRENTFSGCTALETITIPNGVTEIGPHAFFSCESLKNVQLPASLLTIGEYAFYYCDSLGTVYVPKGTELAQCAFPETTKVIRY